MMALRQVEAMAGVAMARAVGVRELIEWAFAVECAQLDFDEEAGRVDPRLGVDPIWRMMRQAELGCRIDGGRHVGLEPVRHSDAELVAAVVARLPVAHGGCSMAVRIAELARARSMPDWMDGARPRVQPAAWKTNRHGTHAATESVGTEWVAGRGGRMRRVDVRCCPVVIHPTPAQIAAARRGYLDWWGALLYLRYELAQIGLARHVVTDAMPPMTPWKKRLTKF